MKISNTRRDLARNNVQSGPYEAGSIFFSIFPDPGGAGGGEGVHSFVLSLHLILDQEKGRII